MTSITQRIKMMSVATITALSLVACVGTQGESALGSLRQVLIFTQQALKIRAFWWCQSPNDQSTLGKSGPIIGSNPMVEEDDDIAPSKGGSEPIIQNNPNLTPSNVIELASNRHRSRTAKLHIPSAINSPSQTRSNR